MISLMVFSLIIFAFLLAFPVSIAVTLYVNAQIISTVRRLMGIRVTNSIDQLITDQSPVTTIDDNLNLKIVHVTTELETLSRRLPTLVRVQAQKRKLALTYASAAMAYCATVAIARYSAMDLSWDEYVPILVVYLEWLIINITPALFVLVLIISPAVRGFIFATIISLLMVILYATLLGLNPWISLQLFLNASVGPSIIIMILQARRFRATGPLTYIISFSFILGFFGVVIESNYFVSTAYPEVFRILESRMNTVLAYLDNEVYFSFINYFYDTLAEIYAELTNANDPIMSFLTILLFAVMPLSPFLAFNFWC